MQENKARLRPSDERCAHPCIPRDGDRITSVGQSGSGKTTVLVRSLVRDVVDEGRKALLFDPTGDVTKYLLKGGAANEPLAAECVARVRSVGEAREQLEGGGVSAWFRRSPVRVLSLTLKECPTYDALMKLWLELALHEDRDGWVLFADEGYLLFPTTLNPKQPAMKLLGLVRNRRQRLYTTANYMVLLATQLRSNTEHACVFRLSNQRQVDACEWLGDSAWFERSRRLEKFRYLYRGPTTEGELPELSAITSPLPW